MAYEPVKLEQEMLNFWEKNKVLSKLKKKVAKGKSYYFLDGPPYTSGKVHVGTAWNRSMKDCYRRYLWMTGLNVNDTPGFDMHGLPIEVKVEKKLGISKQDIAKFGIDKFIKECRKFALKNMEIMIKDFKQIGEWMDWENPYMTIKKEYMEGAWWAIKKAHEKNLLYKGLKVMTWCPRCATALAKHELEYKTISDESIFVKFKVAGKENEYLLVWTTTPWTIPFNLAVMVHPDFDYLKIKVDNEVWVVAKALANALMGVIGKKYQVLEELKGKKLEGVKYTHPLLEEIPLLQRMQIKYKNIHKVILSEEFVDTSSGTGLVHCAPGCGPEDQKVGAKYNLPAFNELDEHGAFSKNMGKYAGWIARKDDDKFIEELKSKDVIIHTSKVSHEYAHCWRCKSAVVFNATEQWFIGVEKLKKELLEANKKIQWIPKWAGEKWFSSWLENLQDWCISRQRFWGIPLPIWLCTCGESYIVESADELKKLSGEMPKDLHKPWIDEIKIKCKCGKFAERVPDVIDVWLDSAAATWASLNTKDREKAISDFILEGKDQIRGWFYSLLALSYVAREIPAYKSVYMHGFVLDAYGRKMSKSMGNVIEPSEIIDKWGADTFRYYTIGGTDPGVDLNYNFEDVKLKNKLLNILWNMHVYLINYAKFFGKDLTKTKFEAKTIEDKYILSKTNSAISKVSGLFKKKELDAVPNVVEELYLELSRGYIQTMREEVTLNKLKILFDCYLTVLKLAAPVVPFITEAIWQNLKSEFGLKEESVHLCDWPTADKKLINTKLENDLDIVKKVVSYILSAREKANRPLRWQVKKITLVTSLDTKTIEKYKDLILSLTNVLEVDVKEKFDEAKVEVKADYAKLGPKFGKAAAQIIMRITEQSPESILQKIEKDGKYKVKLDSGEEIDIVKEDLIVKQKLLDGWIGHIEDKCSVYLETRETPEMLKAGFTREIIRKVQALRKKAGLDKPDNISLIISTDVELNLDEIKTKVGAIDIKLGKVEKKWVDKFNVRGKEISIGFDVEN